MVSVITKEIKRLVLQLTFEMKSVNVYSNIIVLTAVLIVTNLIASSSDSFLDFFSQ